jgi:hypothetical protein
MAKSRVCLLDPEANRIEGAPLNCGNQSHAHISRVEAIELVCKGAVEWVEESGARSQKGIVRILKRNYAIRGLSSKVGAILAHALTENRQPWACVMLSDIQRRREA